MNLSPNNAQSADSRIERAVNYLKDDLRILRIPLEHVADKLDVPFSQVPPALFSNEGGLMELEKPNRNSRQKARSMSEELLALLRDAFEEGHDSPTLEECIVKVEVSTASASRFARAVAEVAAEQQEFPKDGILPGLSSTLQRGLERWIKLGWE